MQPRRQKPEIPAAVQVARYARQLGARRTLLRSAYVGVNNMFAVSLLDCVRLAPVDVDERAESPDTGLECRFLEPDEVEHCNAALDALSAGVAREALARGDSCYGVLERGRLVNTSFYAPSPTPVLGDLVVRFDPPRWYMYGAYTPPAHRGRRLHALGVLSAARELFDRGVPELLAVYERTNYASMASTLRMGWRRCGTLVRVGIGHRMVLGRTQRAREAGLRLERRRPAGEA